MTPLIAGNTVILKTSEHVPATQRLWAEILYEAGLPAGCISVIHMSPEDAPDLVSKLIEDKRVRWVGALFELTSDTSTLQARLAWDRFWQSAVDVI